MTTLKPLLWHLLTVVCFLAPGTVGRADETDEAGFKPIFNGENLDGWDGNPKLWSVEDGTIRGQTTPENPTSGNTFLIWREGTVDDFVLRLKYKIPNGNSGIQYRSREDAKWVIGGYQADLESADTFSGILYDERGRGILALRGQEVVMGEDGTKTEKTVADGKGLQAGIKKDDWNEYEIIAQGNHLIHKINGVVMCEFTDHQTSRRAMSGLSALQLHAGPPMVVYYKDIELKRTKLADGRKKLVMVAGQPSHGPGDHEFNAGSLLLKKCLDENVPQLLTVVYRDGWPNDPTAFDNADAICLYMDGGDAHPVIQRNRNAEIDQLVDHGVGLACLHYAVEVPKEKGGPDFLKWIGGYFEAFWSVNPHWMLDKTVVAQGHPIARGVKPFTIQDEWYYHMRFRDRMAGVKPILSAVPPEETRNRGDGAHSGNEHVRARKGMSEVLAWATVRPDGGRGFGFTGGHFHKNWGQDDFRKLVLNALVWISGLEVPEGGVLSTVTEADLAVNLDPK